VCNGLEPLYLDPNMFVDFRCVCTFGGLMLAFGVCCDSLSFDVDLSVWRIWVCCIKGSEEFESMCKAIPPDQILF